MSARSFQVSPSPGHALPILVALLCTPVIGFAIAAATGEDTDDLRKLWPVLLILPAVFGLLLYAFHRRAVTLQDGLLVVRAGLQTRRVAATALDLDRARVVDVREHTQLRPALKTGGMSLPGFHAGTFRMRDRLNKGFYLLTDQRRVLWLPQRDGGALLVSLEQPQQLLDALRTVANSVRAS